MNKKRSVGIIISYINMAVNMVTGLFLSSYLLQMLGDTEYGLYQTVASFANYLVLLEFGTGAVMTRNISVCVNKPDLKDRQEAINRNYSTVWIISLILSAVMLLAGLLFYHNLGAIYSHSMNPEQVAYGQKIILFLFVYIIAGYLTQNVSGFLLAREEYSFSNIITLIKIILRTGLLFVLILLSQHAILIAVVDMALNVAVFMVLLLYAKKKYKVKISFRYFDKQVFIASVPMCVALLLQTLINQANSNVDKFVIGIMMSVESVALYSVVQYIFSMFSTIANIPVGMFLPEISKNMTRNLPPKEFTDTLVPPCRLTTVICGSILCGFFAVGKQFISLLYGAEKTDAWLYALIILVPMFLNMTDAVIINVLDIANKRLVRSLALLGTTIANIAMTILFIGMWGIIGAVIATAIALLIGNVMVMNIYYQKKFKIRILYLFKEAYKGVLPFQIVSGAVAFFAAQFIRSPLLGLLAGGALYVLLSFTLIYCFGLKKEEKGKIHSVLKRIKKKK